MSGITAYSAYLKDLPLYWIIPLTVTTFCLFIWGLYGLGRLADWRTNRKQKTDETISDTPESEIQKLKDQYEEHATKLIEAKEVIRDELNAKNQSLREAHKQEIAKLKADFEDSRKRTQERHDGELTQCNVMLDKIQFLFEPESQQRENIIPYVQVVEIEYSRREFEWQPKPYITFALRIRNVSMFDITFESNVDGHLLFRRDTLDEKKKLEKEPPIIKGFGGYDDIRVVQFLSQLDVDTLKIAMHKRKNKVENISLIEFDFTKLVITIKGSRKFPQVVPQTLDLVGKIGRVEDRDI